MKTNDSKKYKIRKIRTMEELKLEKTRLQYEIGRSEDKVKGNYHQLIEALTFANIVANLLQEFAVTSSLLSKAVEAGRTFFANRKKKKKKRKEEKQLAQQKEQQSGGQTGPGDVGSGSA